MKEYSSNVIASNLFVEADSNGHASVFLFAQLVQLLPYIVPPYLVRHAVVMSISKLLICCISFRCVIIELC